VIIGRNIVNLLTPLKALPKTLEKRIWKHYNEKYENYGKAEAVVVELIVD
jgi:hypothetical protein